MASPREYFDADFDNALRVQFRLPNVNESVEGALLLDFASATAFVACYVAEENSTMQFFLKLVSELIPGKQIHFDQRIRLPAGRHFPGEISLANESSIEIKARFFGDPEWVQLSDFQSSRRIYIYSASQLTDAEILVLKAEGRSHDKDVHFRSTFHAHARSQNERPMAFICHDSRDKDLVARRVAIGLQKLLCPVWYDEFSLAVGDNLRESIEQGLKVCKKCILVISPHFLSNRGWTKKEFDSVFAREAFKQEQILLPIWVNVSANEIFDYSPSLLNVKGIHWTKSAEDEVCRQLFNSIVATAGVAR